MQSLAGDSKLSSTQLTQEAAKDVEQCNPYLEHTCEDGHESTVACSLYTLPVVLRDVGEMPRSHPLGIRRFFLQVLQEPPLCVVLRPSIQLLIIGMLFTCCSFHPAAVPLHNGTLPFSPTRFHREQQVRNQVCLLVSFQSAGAQEASFMTTCYSSASASNVVFCTRTWEEGERWFEKEHLNAGTQVHEEKCK